MGTNASKSSHSSGSTNPKKKSKKRADNSEESSKESSMPFFGHKQSEAGRKKLQHQVYLAQESPEATVDLSGCEAVEVPHGIYATCKILRKEALLLHNNWLTSLKEGGNILDLVTIRVLDLHSNELSSLPDEICMLQNLQVLNVEKNKLTKLPNNLEGLQSLQNLNVRKICSQGTEAIMTHLCSECGIEYLPPSNFLLDVLEPPKVVSPSMSNNALKAFAEDVRLMSSFDQYASQQERKRLERIELQREFENHQFQQAQLAAVSAADKHKLIEYLAADELKVFQELNQLSQRREQERKDLVASIQEVELRAADLMNQLLQMNEKARKTEELLEKMEKERIEQEEWFVVRQEESENLRKQEVLVAMEQILVDNENFDKLWKMYENDRREYKQRALESESETNDQINSVLKLKRSEQMELFDVLRKQEKLQMEAFETLQLQKDARTTRLTSQIDLIQEELAELSKVEMERREERQENSKKALSEKRLALTQMMLQLLDERDRRAVELKHRIQEMEQRKKDGQVDYWLVQLQRLMDRKPQELIDQERLLEIAVIKILEKADASDYISLFSRHRITIETMLQLNEEDLKQMGVHEMGLRKSILKQIEEYKLLEVSASSKKETSRAPMALEHVVEATAPPSGEVDNPVQEVKARGVDSECCICMERKSVVIFLPCGHVCSCDTCSHSVTECPLCRATISQRITLFTG
ncbi:E3 ubiquitin-protein ligase LRSAM1-like isoform X3 [Liolophura sinensis]|uniref:E3 ubiquitin-protein ligase LRSAM1-like isoform X3 n=1 Tax=Liolophura sinensis TaxID=3198878 RepID=UPI0031591F03